MPSPKSERPPGRVLAIDPGTVRVGLAISDPLQITAQPLEVIPADEHTVDYLVALISEREVSEIVVGYPVGMTGQLGKGTSRAEKLSRILAERTDRPVQLWDERFSSRMAEQLMVDQDTPRKQRRQNLDKVSASLILAEYLDRK